MLVFIALITAGLGRFALESLFDGLCGSSEIFRVASPDGRHDAVLFEHNCGATTDFATHVSVLPVGTALGSGGGNAFAAGVTATGSRADWGGPPVELEWQPDRTLVIRYDGSAEVFLMANSVEGVVIRSSMMP